MPGNGPPPKPNSGRSQSSAVVPIKTLDAHGVIAQPPLPDGVDWCAETLEWYRHWGESPMAKAGMFTHTDWDFLAESALLHNAVWRDGELKYLPELRIRVAKYAATPEDRLRLRIQFADVSSAEANAEKQISARDRRANSNVIDVVIEKSPDTDDDTDTGS